MDSFASGALMLIGLVAFANYRNGTLPDWLKSKFLNAGDDAAGASSPFEASPAALVTGAGKGAPAAVLTGLGGGLGALLNPVAGAITGVFGESRPGHTHAGIDIAAAKGMPVKASRGGTVSYAGNSAGYGLLVTVDHGGGVSTKYGHLSRIDVTVGQTVRAGQQVGLVGSTGNSTGPHLHFELTQDGKAINPAPYLGTPASVGAALTA